jgi:hypothetical protein
MTKGEVKELLERVLTWPTDDQEKIARFVREVEQGSADDDISEEGQRQRGRACVCSLLKCMKLRYERGALARAY